MKDMMTSTPGGMGIPAAASAGQSILQKLNLTESPVIVLATRDFTHLGALANVERSSISYKRNLNAADDLSFKVYKTVDGHDEPLWDKIVDLKLIWVKEFHEYFEIRVNVNDSDATTKSVTCTSLCEAELGQTLLHDIEINTERDIARDDYAITKFYDEENPKGSLLHRVLSKVPHYHVTHVDSSVARLQRTFSISGKSVYDFLTGECAGEFHCLFQFDSGTRGIAVYDLYTTCLHCGYRGEYADVCPKCQSTDLQVFGTDTDIYVDKENLTDSVTFETDTGSVKNCFRLEAGDDLMTATIRSLNQNGGGEIWYISEEQKDDMPPELVNALANYQKAYDSHTEEYEGLLESLYEAIDKVLYFTSSMMPTSKHDNVTAATEGRKLTEDNLSPLGLSDVTTSTSTATVDGALKSYAKVYVKSGHVKLEVKGSSFSYVGTDKDGFHYGTWTGKFKVTNYSDEEDVYETPNITVKVSDNYESFLQQKIKKLIASSDGDDDEESVFDVLGIKDMDAFKKALKSYCMNRLKSFHDAIQNVLELLIQVDQASESALYYHEMYQPFYDKLTACQEEMKARQKEIDLWQGKYNDAETRMAEIQAELNFENCLGEKLYHIFCSYRREDTYSNSNYVSDGLDNAELFARAREFLDVARKELYKSAQCQHSISTTLHNLLAIPQFEPLFEHFDLGNKISVRADGQVYRLRLVSYTINYSSPQTLAVEFSDMTKLPGGLSDVNGILSTAQSMATSYGYVTNQAGKGDEAKKKLENWVENGLALTKMKIVDNANNQNLTWDAHGLLCREYLPMTDEYSDKQAKIINRGLYLTDDNWRTSKAGIGDFTYYDPESGQMKEDYGVIADTLVGNLILSEKVGVYSTDNSIVLDRNGLVITTDATKEGVNNAALTLRRKTVDENGQEHVEPVMYIDGDGNLVMTGTVHIRSGLDNAAETLQELCDMSKFDTRITTVVQSESQEIYETVDKKYKNVMTSVTEQLDNYKADQDQYLNYDKDGLTLGAKGSPFKTVIDNQSMAFKQGETTISYINNEQLYINSAVINNALKLGKFFLCPRQSGGVSLTWKG